MRATVLKSSTFFFRRFLGAAIRQPGPRPGDLAANTGSGVVMRDRLVGRELLQLNHGQSFRKTGNAIPADAGWNTPFLA